MSASSVIGSVPAILAVPLIAYGLQYIGYNENALTFQLSVMALSFSQFIAREQHKDGKRDKAIQEEQLQIEQHIEKEIATDGN